MRLKIVLLAVLPAVLGGGLTATAASGEPAPAATAPPAPPATPTATPGPVPAETPGPAPDVCPDVPADTSTLTRQEALDLLRTWRKGDCAPPEPRRAARAGEAATYTEDVTLTASSLTQQGLAYDGVVTLPTRDGGLRLLKFSMDAARLTDVKQTTRRSSLRMDALAFSGGVTMYTTRMTGRAFGVLPLTLTPDEPPPLVLPVMTFTDVTVEHTVVRAGTARGTGLDQR